MKHRLIYNQRSHPLLVRRENAALTHEAYASIQPEESPPGGQDTECRFKALLHWLHFSGPKVPGRHASIFCSTGFKNKLEINI